MYIQITNDYENIQIILPRICECVALRNLYRIVDCWRRRVVVLTADKEKCSRGQGSPQPTRQLPNSSLGPCRLHLFWCPHRRRPCHGTCTTLRIFSGVGHDNK